MRRGGVPIAAIVPISRMRSYTAMIITFITATSTMETSMILMNSVSRSIMLGDVGERREPLPGVHLERRLWPCLFLTSSSAGLQRFR